MLYRILLKQLQIKYKVEYGGIFNDHGSSVVEMNRNVNVNTSNDGLDSYESDDDVCELINDISELLNIKKDGILNIRKI